MNNNIQQPPVSLPPPQGNYPPQAYPNGMHPPPPQGHGYAQGNYPPQGVGYYPPHPQPQGYPPPMEMGYPPQGYPPQYCHPPQYGAPPHGHGQGHPPQKQKQNQNQATTGVMGGCGLQQKVIPSYRVWLYFDEPRPPSCVLKNAMLSISCLDNTLSYLFESLIYCLYELELVELAEVHYS
ncbi:protein CYSTEINE-RICH TRANSMEMBRANE MODULE 10-like [Solanum stenotomum]|uniref:protein CYSTEINE-RICH TRANSMEMBRANE MODULE 10-like n=1 Tax=Solanum stenotomum TaxID=172797 RepID=UPI0020D1EE7B|nr:protein CYSTEINE-RICH TRANSMEMBRANE MODULE 10-like [Solanum stenotomum]